MLPLNLILVLLTVKDFKLLFVSLSSFLVAVTLYVLTEPFSAVTLTVIVALFP